MNICTLPAFNQFATIIDIIKIEQLVNFFHGLISEFEQHHIIYKDLIFYENRTT